MLLCESRWCFIHVVTVKPLRTDASITWTPLYYGQFSWCQRNQNLYNHVQWNPDFLNLQGNANWFEKSGVQEIEGGIKLRLIGRVLFGYE